MSYPLSVQTWKRRAEIAVRSASIQVSVKDGEPLPTEFQLFKYGVNESTRGPALFDAKSANAVMAEYKRQGVDVMIDLEHLSLEDTEDSRNYDPDARGWCKLELRDDGLWAVDVRWTPDGEARLRECRQRYISPAFYAEKETGRVLEMINVALVAMPATHDAPALVAAKRSKSMDPAKLKEALEAIKNGDATKALEILESLVLELAGGVPVDESGEGEAFSEPMPEEEQAAVAASFKKLHRAVALSAQLAKLTGKEDETEALETVEAWRKTVVEIEEREAKVAKDRGALEANERRRLVGELVKLGSETPATAWSDDKGSVPCKRLADEPIAEIRTRVAALSKAKGRQPPRIVPPQTGGGSNNGEPLPELTESQIALCKKRGIDPEKARAEFAKTRKAINERSAARVPASDG